MESLPPVNLTGESSAVLEDGVAQDPKQQREVSEDTDDDYEETDDEETDDEETYEDNELHQLILEKRMLNGEVSALLVLVCDEKVKQIELADKHIERMVELKNRLQKWVKKRNELYKLLFSGQSSSSTSITFNHYSGEKGLQMESLPLVHLTDKSPAVLEDGVARHDPNRQREVEAETDGLAPVTKKSSNLEDKKQQLILENQKLKERIINLHADIAKLKEDIPKRDKKYKAQLLDWENDCKNLVAEIAEIVRFLNSRENTKNKQSYC